MKMEKWKTRRTTATIWVEENTTGADKKAMRKDIIEADEGDYETR